MLQNVLKGLGKRLVGIQLAERLGKRIKFLSAFEDLGNGCMLGRGKGKEVWRDPVEVSVLHSLKLLILVEVEVVEGAAALLLGLPDAVDNILDGDAVVGLGVSSVAEGHQRWVDLSDGGQGQVRGPVLNEDHVAGEHASSVGATL